MAGAGRVVRHPRHVPVLVRWDGPCHAGCFGGQSRSSELLVRMMPGSGAAGPRPPHPRLPPRPSLERRHIWLCKTRRSSIFTHGLFRNPVTLIGTVISIFVILVIVYVPQLHSTFWTNNLHGIGCGWMNGWMSEPCHQGQSTRRWCLGMTARVHGNGSSGPARVAWPGPAAPTCWTLLMRSARVGARARHHSRQQRTGSGGEPKTQPRPHTRQPAEHQDHLARTHMGLGDRWWWWWWWFSLGGVGWGGGGEGAKGGDSPCRTCPKPVDVSKRAKSRTARPRDLARLPWPGPWASRVGRSGPTVGAPQVPEGCSQAAANRPRGAMCLVTPPPAGQRPAQRSGRPQLSQSSVARRWGRSGRRA